MNVLLDSAVGPAWYALQVRPCYEQRIEAALVPRVEAFYPWRAVKSGIRNQITIRKPFFPGYVFARLESLQQLPAYTGIPQGWKLVSDSPIPDIEIESVKQLALAKVPISEHPPVRIGETIRVTRGPLAGVEGKVVRFPGGPLLVVSIEIMGRAVATQLDLETVEAVLRSEPHQACSTSVPPPPMHSGSTAVTSSIASVTNRINGLIFRTRTMLDLLEL